jgi:hypothetical protein
VARTRPLLADSSPFPTTYYLTHPGAIKAIGRLESGGLMAEMNQRLRTDPELAAAMMRAHLDYLRRRQELGQVPAISQISAGGMPRRVKCLHALAAHALAAGPDVNPLGDLVLIELAPVWRPDRCSCSPGPAQLAQPASAKETKTKENDG